MPTCKEYQTNKTTQDKNGNVYCPINRGECPHNNEGHLVRYNGKITILCKTGGLFGKVLEEDKPIIKKALNQLYFPKRKK